MIYGIESFSVIAGPGIAGVTPMPTENVDRDRCHESPADRPGAGRGRAASGIPTAGGGGIID
jgi:hypothetical protein